MDHMPFVIAQDAGSEGFALHGGTVDCRSGEYSPHVAYSCVAGRLHCALIGVSVALADQNAGDGGFIAVCGSHKANFAAPKALIHGGGAHGGDGVIDARLSQCITQPVVKAGDVLIFSEGTAHGARPWTAAHERRVALYRFAPATCSYGRTYCSPSWPQDMVDALDEAQRAVLEPPYALRADRPMLSASGDAVTLCSRAHVKKEHDKRVFGTDYF